MKESRIQKQQRKIEQQETARSLRNSLVRARARRRAANEFSRIQVPNLARILPRRKIRNQALDFFINKDLNQADNSNFQPSEISELRKIKNKYSNLAEEKINRSKDKFSRNRTRLAVRVASNFPDLMKRIERNKMFDEAGYGEHRPTQMLNKVGWTTLFALGLGSFANVIRGFVPIVNNAPLIDRISTAYITTFAYASVAAYMAFFALETYVNLRLTRKFGKSANPYTTAIDAAGERLLSKKGSGATAIMVPLLLDAAINASYNAALSGNPLKVITANCLLILYNIALSIGGLVVLKTFGNKRKEKDPTKDPTTIDN